MFLAGGEMLFSRAGEHVSIMLCGCGLPAGASRLLGGKGLGGGPDEDREAFIFPTFTYGELTDMWFLFSRRV